MTLQKKKFVVKSYLFGQCAKTVRCFHGAIAMSNSRLRSKSPSPIRQELQKDFSAKAKEASTALGTIKDASNNVSQALVGFQGASESTKQFHEQVQGLTKNLTSLNTIYELELQESNNHLKALNQFYGKLSEASAAMNGTAQDALKAKEQIAALATNLTKLNQVYGSMLSAMQVK